MTVTVDGFEASGRTPSSTSPCPGLCPGYVNGTYILDYSATSTNVCYWEYTAQLPTDTDCATTKVSLTSARTSAFGGTFSYDAQIVVTVSKRTTFGIYRYEFGYQYETQYFPWTPVGCKEFENYVFPKVGWWGDYVGDYCSGINSVCYLNPVPNP